MSYVDRNPTPKAEKLFCEPTVIQSSDNFVIGHVLRVVCY